MLLKRFFVILTPVATAYILLHHTPIFLAQMPGNFNYLHPENIVAIWRSNLSWLGAGNVYYGLAICVFLAYGPAWFLALSGLYLAVRFPRWEAKRAFVALWGLALPVAASLLLVDWRRCFQPLFPAVICWAVIGFHILTRRSRPFEGWLLVGATTIAAAGAAEAWWIQPMRMPVIIGIGIWISVLSFVLLRSSINDRPHATKSGLGHPPNI